MIGRLCWLTYDRSVPNYRVVALALMGFIMAAAGSCASNDPEVGPTDYAEAFAVLTRHVADTFLEPDPTATTAPVLYLESFDPAGVDLETQVGVVGLLADDYEIRFVDRIDEATDVEVEGRPVRSGSLLIGFGPRIDVTESRPTTVEQRVEVYFDAATVEAFRYRLLWRRSSGWTIDGDPEPVTAELFVAEP